MLLLILYIKSSLANSLVAPKENQIYFIENEAIYYDVNYNNNKHQINLTFEVAFNESNLLLSRYFHNCVFSPTPTKQEINFVFRGNAKLECAFKFGQSHSKYSSISKFILPQAKPEEAKIVIHRERYNNKYGIIEQFKTYPCQEVQPFMEFSDKNFSENHYAVNISTNGENYSLIYYSNKWNIDENAKFFSESMYYSPIKGYYPTDEQYEIIILAMFREKMSDETQASIILETTQNGKRIETTVGTFLREFNDIIYPNHHIKFYAPKSSDPKLILRLDGIYYYIFRMNQVNETIYNFNEFQEQIGKIQVTYANNSLINNTMFTHILKAKYNLVSVKPSQNYKKMMITTSHYSILKETGILTLKFENGQELMILNLTSEKDPNENCNLYLETGFPKKIDILVDEVHNSTTRNDANYFKWTKKTKQFIIKRIDPNKNETLLIKYAVGDENLLSKWNKLKIYDLFSIRKNIFKNVINFYKNLISNIEL